MALRDMLYGLTQNNPEEADRMEEMLRRLQAASVEAKTGQGNETVPFGGIMLQQGQQYAEAGDQSPPRMPDAPPRKTAPRSAEAPSTSGWSPRMGPSAPLEERSAPENFRVPQTAPIVQSPRAQAAKMDRGGAAPQAPKAQSPDFFDRLGAFSRGYNSGGLVGAIADGFGSGLDRQFEQQNMTVNALTKMGLPPEMAGIVARNPDLMKVILAQSMGGNAPDIKEIETKDEYGRVTKVPVVYNRATRKWERLDIDGAASSAMPAQGGNPAPVSPVPAALQPPTAPTAPAAPSMRPAMPSAPTAQAQPQFVERPINVNTLPAPMKGYTYDRGPNGYPLFDVRNNPKMIPEKALESKSTSTDDAFKLREVVSGIDKSFKLANEISNHPGLRDVAGRAFGGEAQVKGVGVTLPDITPGTAQADAFNLHQTLLSDVALRTMDQLKAASAQGATGFGALSEKELAILQSSAGNLKLSSSYDELLRNYRKFQSALMNARERLMDKYREKYGDVPEGITPKQELIDSTVGDAIGSVGRPVVRPRHLGPFDIPFTQTTDSEPSAAPRTDPDAGRFFPSLGGSSAPAPRGIPQKAPPGALPVSPNSGYPPGTKATRNPNNPNEWIIWTLD